MNITKLIFSKAANGWKMSGALWIDGVPNGDGRKIIKIEGEEQNVLDLLNRLGYRCTRRYSAGHGTYSYLFEEKKESVRSNYR